ncbi:glycosyltransferase [Leptodesmis sichuanensis]|uniref:glycosyltransferase n=1 Tax=Leptodesmis sichuanensis TaxID=2906798 RepID=UPI001F2250FC|nr:glycosyltransferase [Leptodesmis sichuanensis]UIE37513.1 glycosyltransferase family 4 protein [Leptodesmis sichuanensis A121]
MKNTMGNDTLDSWREEGRRLVSQNSQEFRKLVSQARDYLERSDYDTAAIYGEMAASYASSKHPGLFASPELEHILLTIGQQAIKTSPYIRKSTTSARFPEKILHVGTSMVSIGGHSKFLRRWINQDSNCSHSLVLTRQFPNEVPKLLSDAVSNSHGKIYTLNNYIGSIITWAKRLREIAVEADLVVLHIHNYDVIPILAFAVKEQCPPVAFLDHADHIFWLGASVSDVVISLRESAMQITRQRRGIEAKRNVLLPITLEPIQRTVSRKEAKQQLGLPEDSIVLLSIARAPKYKTINGISFADAHLPLLKQHSQTILLVVGAGDRRDWSDAIQQSGGRILSFNETENTSIYYQAADIYVDSYPFSSNTSLLEAGSYEIPLVSRFPYPSDACAILGADAPGLTNHLIYVQNLEEYTAVLSRLVQEEDHRSSLGKATRRKIVETHMEPDWQRFLNKVYASITTLPKRSVFPHQIDQIVLDEPDVFLPRVFGSDKEINFGSMMQWYLPLMPFSTRFHHWLDLVKQHKIFQYPPSLLLPEWFRCNYYFYRSYYFLLLKRVLRSIT